MHHANSTNLKKSPKTVKNERQELTPKAIDGGHVQTNENAIKSALVREIGGYNGVEPTRFGDWEKSGRCIDF